MNVFWERLYKHVSSDKNLLCLVVIVPVILTVVGLLVLASASLSFFRTESLLHKQLCWVVISLFFFAMGAFIDLEFFGKHIGKILLAFAILLALVLLPGFGHSVNGSRRWISIAGINFQISEFVKFALIMWLAAHIDRVKGEIKSFYSGFFKPLAVASCIGGLIIVEPDYGTAILLEGVAFTLLFLYGSKISYLLGAALSAVGCLSILIFFNPVRMRRILSFIDIDSNKLGGAYQLWQGILGFASGGLWGNGIGNGRQQLVYLPEAHTDFILPILGEELGSVVAIAVLCLYLIFFIACIVGAMKLESTYHSAIICGIVLLMAYQVIINVGVVSGLLPTKGMVLPFISYGGSNLLTMYFLLGILLNCFASSGQNNSDVERIL